ncbi:YciI family protein [Pseudomonas ogarae]|uniref:YciI family protein n=1 Tax=Pseudomonas ogarae (strain DSM 112162 / CECT 30235 / F113) TaxID=1114970 RepID=A0ABM6R1D6_PSEO1|nr:YciI family protein [Pseudomonas ogarae]AEV63447.1 YciL [Pseudomonas ogarae]AUO47298.1 YciI family protein [Pseudomonas ogarae]
MGHFFAIFATDHPDSLALRQRLRPSHQAHLRASDTHRVIVRLGGPTLNEAGLAMNGTLLVVEAGSLPEVEAFVQDDPYVRAGLFATIQIRPWHWSLGNPELRG